MIQKVRRSRTLGFFGGDCLNVTIKRVQAMIWLILATRYLAVREKGDTYIDSKDMLHKPSFGQWCFFTQQIWRSPFVSPYPASNEMGLECFEHLNVGIVSFA